MKKNTAALIPHNASLITLFIALRTLRLKKIALGMPTHSDTG
jgi:hypothetical protein